MEKTIVKGKMEYKMEYYCDVCEKQCIPDNSTIWLLINPTFFGGDKIFHLCIKHGKKVKSFMKQLKLEESE